MKYVYIKSSIDDVKYGILHIPSNIFFIPSFVKYPRCTPTNIKHIDTTLKTVFLEYLYKLSNSPSMNNYHNVTIYKKENKQKKQKKRTKRTKQKKKTHQKTHLPDRPPESIFSEYSHKCIFCLFCHIFKCPCFLCDKY